MRRLLSVMWHLVTTVPITVLYQGATRNSFADRRKHSYLDKVRVAAQCAAREAGLPLGIPVQAPHDHCLVPAAPHTSLRSALFQGH